MILLRRLQFLAAALSEASGRISSIALLIMTVGITGDVLARSILGSGTKAAVELTGYLMVAVVFMGLAPAERVQAHIRIDLVLNLLPNSVARILNLLNSILFLVYCVVLTYLGLRSALTSYAFGTTSRTNIDIIVWPFQLLVPIGLLVLILVLATQIVSSKEQLRDDGRGTVVHD